MFAVANVFAQENSVFPTNGYRGSAFVYMAVNGDDFDTYSLGTTHGYQLNTKWFIGGGMQYNRGSLFYRQQDYIFESFTEYADIRLDMIKKAISPYLNFKLGYTIGDIEGYYLAPELGVRFRHFNLGVGFECQNHEAVYGLSTKNGNEDSELFMIRLAYDFKGRKK